MIFGQVAQNHALTVKKKRQTAEVNTGALTVNDRIVQEQNNIRKGKNSERPFVIMVVTEQKLTSTYSLINMYLDSD